MSHPLQIYTTTSTMDISTTNDRIELAIGALNSQKGLSFKAAAIEYRVDRLTLARRFNGKCLSRTAATLIYHQNLTDVEEDTLISYINSLTDRFIPPTP
jgi:transcriptional regulator with XRE-family HTH domain